MAEQAPQEENPFPGLRAFEPSETHLFFGRDGQSDELLRMLARNRFVAVVGTSGSGKSSLVKAGVVAALRSGLMTEAGSSWRVSIMRPGASPISGLADSLDSPRALGRGDLDAGTRHILIETTLRRSSFGLIEAVRQARMDPDENLLVLVDQFEEIFRLRTARRLVSTAEDEAAAFVKLLLEATEQTELPIYVIITMRSDFLGDCAEFRGLPEALNRSQYLIPRMIRGQRKEAIEGPVAVGGTTITPRLLQRLLNDAGDDPDQLPILQHALMRTWNAWRGSGAPDSPLDLQHYESIGGMTTALSRHADDAFDALDATGKAIAQRLFQRLSDRGPGNRETRRPTRLLEICAVAEATENDVIATIDRFRTGDRTFLIPPATEKLSPDSVIDISHESLIRLWNRLREWVDEEAESASLYRRLADAAARHKADRAALWRDPELQLALDWRDREHPNQAWAARYDPNFGDAIQFLEKSRRQRSVTKGIRFATIIALVGLTVVALYAQQQAKREAQKALDRQLSAQSLADLDLRPQQALLLGVESSSFARDAEDQLQEEQLLHTLLAQTGGVPLAVHASTVAFSPDGHWLAASDVDGTVRLWDATHSGSVATILSGQSGRISSLVFSPDGHWLATGSVDGIARLWDLANQKSLPVLLRGHHGAINALAINPDSSWLATASDDWTARLWNLKQSDPSEGSIVLSGHTKPVTGAAFSPKGHWLATSSKEDHCVHLWDMTGHHPTALHTLRDKPPLNEDALLGIAFSPDERLLAVAYGYAVQVWDLTAADPPATPILQGNFHQWIQTLAFSPDGRWLVSGSIDATAKVWDVTAPHNPPIVLRGHRATITAARFSPAGRWLATASSDDTARLWDTTDWNAPPIVLRGQESAINAIGFSPDGRRFATAADHSNARLWKIPDPSLDPLVLRGQEETVRVVAFSANGQRFATGSDDRTIRVWSISEPDAPPLVLRGFNGSVRAAAFGADGHWLATAASGDPFVRLWDLTAADPSAKPVLLRQDSEVMNLAFSFDGHWLATAGWDRNLRLWNMTASNPSSDPDFRCTQESPVRGLAFSADGRELVTGSHGYSARVWKLNEMNPCANPIVIFPAGSVVNDVAISHDSRWIATTSWEPTFQARLWDLTTPNASDHPIVLKFKDRVFTVAFSPDGHWMAAGAWDNGVQLLDLTQPTKPPFPLVGNQGRVLVVAFSPDGSSLASLSEDHTIRLWDPTHPAAEPVILYDEAGFSSMAFSPDSRWLITGNIDGAVKLWQMKLPDLIDSACRTAGRNLTAVEWRSLFSQSPYQKSCPNLP